MPPETLSNFPPPIRWYSFSVHLLLNNQLFSQFQRIVYYETYFIVCLHFSAEDFIQNEYPLDQLEAAIREHASGAVIKNCIVYD